jgi:hypothetical protein
VTAPKPYIEKAPAAKGDRGQFTVLGAADPMNNRLQPNHSRHQQAETEKLKDQLKKPLKVAG